MAKRRASQPTPDQWWKTALLIVAAFGGLVTAFVQGGTFVRDTFYSPGDPRPDLRVAPDTPHCPFRDGVGVFDLENLGPADVGPFSLTVTNGLNPDEQIEQMAPAAPGLGAAVLELTLSDCLDDDCFVVIELDSTNEIDEANEANNTWVGVCDVLVTAPPPSI